MRITSTPHGFLFPSIDVPVSLSLGTALAHPRAARQMALIALRKTEIEDRLLELSVSIPQAGDFPSFICGGCFIETTMMTSYPGVRTCGERRTLDLLPFNPTGELTHAPRTPKAKNLGSL
jgi:hypothetical protein